MRRRRIGAAAVVLLISGLAFMGIGAGSALATTQLCKVNSSPAPCPAIDVYPLKSVFKVHGEAAFSGFGCAFSYTFEPYEESGTRLSALITPFTFTGCSPSTTVALVDPPWKFWVFAAGGGAGNAEMIAGPRPELEIGSGCRYEAPVIPQKFSPGGMIGSTSPTTLTRYAGLCASTQSVELEGSASPSFYVTN